MDDKKINITELEQIKYSEVINLHSDGLSCYKIAKITDIRYNTVHDWIKFGIEKTKLKWRKYHEANKIEISKRAKERYKNNKIEISKRGKEDHQASRCIVLNHYSHNTMSCIVCGNNDIRVLDLHHTNNNGKEDRKKYGAGKRFYRSLIKRGFPDGYEVLCSCCNHDIEWEWRRYGTSKEGKRILKLKILIMSHYSNGTPKCSICGDSNLQHLTMDVINGGHTHNKNILGTGANFLRYLRKNSYPPIAQVLCWNCQRIKAVENGEKGKYASEITYPVGIQERAINGKLTSSQCAGVYWNGRRWSAQTYENGKCLGLGSFETEELANKRVMDYKSGKWIKPTERTYNGNPTISHYNGVYKKGNGWQAQIWVNGKNLCLGTFDTEELAKKRIEEVKFGEWNGSSIREKKRKINEKLCSSQYRGVYKNKNKWYVRIQIDEKRLFLGSFSTEIEAVKAYDTKAIEFGKKPNFPILDPPN